MHPEIEAMELRELVEYLEDLEDRRTPVGWSPDDAVKRMAVERRIMALVGGDSPEDDRRTALRLPCRLDVKLRSKEKSVRSRVGNIGRGGVFVETDAQFVIGTHVELEVRGAGSDEHGLRVRGKIAWIDEGAGVGICFSDQPSDAHLRRLRRFVLELLRHRIAN